MEKNTISPWQRRFSCALVTALCTSALAVGCASKTTGDDEVNARSGAIIGGSTATLGQSPWMVNILLSGAHKCGGSLIAPDWVLTAGHCIYDGSGVPLPFANLSVVAGNLNISGAGGGQTRAVAMVPIPHPQFSFATIPPHFDAALIRLASPMTLNANVSPIRIAVAQDQSGSARTSGWGSTDPGTNDHSDNLLYVQLPLLLNSACDGQVTPAGSLIRPTFPDELCAGTLTGQGTCSGDSGGPLATQRSSGTYEQVGVTSWGDPFGCHTYSVFNRVSLETDFIRKYVPDPAQEAGRLLLM